MEFASGVLGSEPPVNSGPSRVPLRHAGSDGSFQVVLVGVASAQAGPGQHAELDLRHIQPASVLGSVVELQPLGNAPGLRPPGRSRKARPSDGCSELSKTSRITGTSGYASSTSQRIWWAKSCMVRRFVIATWRQPRRGSQARNRLRVPRPLVFVVLTPRPPGLCWQRFPDVGQQLGAGLVKTDHRPLRIVGLGVEIQHVLHGRHELSTYLGDAPLFLEPRLERVFFSRRRTVSGDKDSTNPNSTTLPARARMVQWS